MNIMGVVGAVLPIFAAPPPAAGDAARQFDKVINSVRPPRPGTIRPPRGSTGWPLLRLSGAKLKQQLTCSVLHAIKLQKDADQAQTTNKWPNASISAAGAASIGRTHQSSISFIREHKAANGDKALPTLSRRLIA